MRLTRVSIVFYLAYRLKTKKFFHSFFFRLVSTLRKLHPSLLIQYVLSTCFLPGKKKNSLPLPINKSRVTQRVQHKLLKR